MKNLKKILVAVICLMLIASMISCNTTPPETSSETTGETEPESTGESETKGTNESTTESNGETESEPESKTESETESETEIETESRALFHDTTGWIAVPMVTQALFNSGFKGGEGCQAVNYLYFVESDPTGQLAFFGTDVGDIYRSTDAGKNWEPCTVGFAASGGTSIVADPKNPSRILCLGTNAGQHEFNVLYISKDAGLSWEACGFKTAPNAPSGFRDSNDQIAFDPTTYDEEAGYCKTVYWARGNTGDTMRDGIYVSYDGGESWTRYKGTANYTGGCIAVSASGNLICTNSNGIFVKKAGEKNFEQLLDKNIYGMDYVVDKDIGYCNSATRLYKTVDGGLTWTVVVGTKEQIKDTTLTKFTDISNPRNIRVSPANPDYISIFDDTPGYNDKKSWISHDGGVTFTQSRKVFEGQWIPYNADYYKFAWSPVDENLVIITWCNIYRSTDGGYTFRWSNAGYNGICTTGLTNFNMVNPDYISVSSQDYCGGFSTDGGRFWKYMNWTGKSWGGFAYGTYALTDKVVVAGGSDGSVSEGNGNPYLWITYDGGNSFQNTGKKVAGVLGGCGSLTNADIAFFGEYRTEDCGKTWKAMSGCRGVFTVDYKTGALFGVSATSDGYIVVSTDEGVTWQKVVRFSSKVRDIAFDYESRKLYACIGNSDYSWIDYKLCVATLDENYNIVGELTAIDIGDTNSHTDSDGVLTVCIDPNHPNIVYAGCGSTYYFDMNCIWRSMDSGETWECISRQPGDGYDGYTVGGSQPRCIRVNPKTGYLFVFTSCRGVWKISGPMSVYGTN